MSDILAQLRGKRSASWDHTAAIILHFRRVMGDKKTQYEKVHPYASGDESQQDKRARFKSFNQERNKR